MVFIAYAWLCSRYYLWYQGSNLGVLCARQASYLLYCFSDPSTTILFLVWKAVVLRISWPESLEREISSSHKNHVCGHLSLGNAVTNLLVLIVLNVQKSQSQFRSNADIRLQIHNLPSRHLGAFKDTTEQGRSRKSDAESAFQGRAGEEDSESNKGSCLV